MLIALKPHLSQAWVDRFTILSRTAAAVLGGYFFTYAATALLSVLLPLDPPEAVLSAQMLGFALYTAAIIASFAARTVWRAWGILLIPGAVCYLLAFAPQWLGG